MEEPERGRISSGNIARYPEGRPSAMPGPVVCVLPCTRAVKPVVRANPTGRAATVPGVLCTRDRTAFGSAPGCTSTCQATATERTARWVMVALEAVRKEPSAATRATASAIPATAATRRPVR